MIKNRHIFRDFCRTTFISTTNLCNNIKISFYLITFIKWRITFFLIRTKSHAINNCFNWIKSQITKKKKEKQNPKNFYSFQLLWFFLIEFTYYFFHIPSSHFSFPLFSLIPLYLPILSLLFFLSSYLLSLLSGSRHHANFSKTKCTVFAIYVGFVVWFLFTHSTPCLFWKCRNAPMMRGKSFHSDWRFNSKKKNNSFLIQKKKR